MYKDLETRADLESLFRNFYAKAIKDSQIGHFFTEVIPIDLETHLPHILGFWEYNLFHKGSYNKNLLAIHQNIHNKSNITYQDIDQWVLLLHQSTDKLFQGASAERLKTNALSIATVMKTKVKSVL